MNQEVKPEDQQEMLAERFQAFGSRLSKLASEQSAARSQVEQRWLEDIRQFHGEYTEEEKARMQQSDGSQMLANITRNKTNAAEARLQDMLFPTDDRNFGIKPTPVPMLSPMAGSGDEAQKAQIEAEAKAKAEAMQTEIDDQLNESRYPIKALDVIHDAAQIGTGILKGPVIVGRSRKRWTTNPDGMSVLEVVESLDPAVDRVDPWNFYPDMSARTLEEAEFIFERHLWTKKQLREFAKLPGVVRSQLDALVRGDKGGQRIAQDHIDDIRAITGVNAVQSSGKYEVWEYHGPIDKAELMDAIEGSEEEFSEEELEGIDDEVDAVVFFSGQHILKVVINPMDTEEYPYSVFNWEKNESSIFGFGIPYLMRNPAKMMNAAIRMLMDNAGASVSDIIVANREIIRPSDGIWTSNPGKKKLYYLTDKTKTVRDAFAAFSIPNHQVELERIFQIGRQLADEETNMPLIAQGEQSSNITKTSSGMAMLMNSSNIVMRRGVKNWDDDVTRSLIGRYYDWNMQFSDDPAIKGDFSVDARGSGALLVREKQQENLMIYANISASNPELALMRDWKGLDKEISKALEVPHEKLTLSDEEVKKKREAMAQQQPDPTVEIKKAELQIKAQNSQMEFQLKQQQMQIDTQFRELELQERRYLKLVDIASREKITVEQLRANVGLKEMQEKTKRDIAAIHASHSEVDLQLKAYNQAAGYDSFG